LIVAAAGATGGRPGLVVVGICAAGVDAGVAAVVGEA
jgi:hypothetical protein